MSKELFGEALKHRNKIAETYKQNKKKKENWIGKNGRKLSDDKLYTINFFLLANGDIIYII